MKKLGYLLITVGFLGGALASVVDKDRVEWVYFGVAVAVGALGVATVRLSEKQASTSERKLAVNMQSIETVLCAVVENMGRLEEEKGAINTYDVRHRIDELFRDDLARFVDARESIGHVYGLSAYGDVMSSFAAGERYLNRVWSASADGYIDEVNAYIDKAREQFVDSLEKIRQLKVTAALHVS